MYHYTTTELVSVEDEASHPGIISPCQVDINTSSAIDFKLERVSFLSLLAKDCIR